MDGQLRIIRVKAEEKTRKSPQPSVKKFKPIKKFEILHRPFDLRFKGRINKWLESLADWQKGLDKEQVVRLKLYFFPQKNKWLSQKQVNRKIKGKLWKFRKETVEILLVIWSK